jgi:xanthine/CO dehydrogenase XdhC/CoxF family maturation factor
VGEILTDVSGWLQDGDRAAIATVVKTWGSTPRPVGSVFAVSSSGKVAGSVSGGCLEAAVYEEAMEVIGDGRPRLLHYGISDEMAFQVGLSCGGEVDLFIEPLTW